MTGPRTSRAGYDLAGYAFLLEWATPVGGAVADRLFTSCRTDEASDGDTYVLVEDATGTLLAHKGGEIVATGYSATELAAYLDAAIANAALEHLTGVVAVHAGAVAHRGEALVLAGVGGSGKTTLTTALSLAGLEPLCDDMLLVEDGGRRLRGLPRSFLVKAETGAWLARQRPELADCAFGDGLYSVPRYRLGQPADEAAPRWLVFPTYKEGAGVSLTPLGQLAAVERLLPLACLPHREVFGLVEVVRGSEAFALAYGRRAEATAALLDLVHPELP